MTLSTETTPAQGRAAAPADGAAVPGDGARGPAASPPASSAPPGRPGMNPVALGVIVVLALALAGWGGARWWWSRTHVSTDNAQVEGHVVPVLAKVGGYVASVAVRDNQRVEAGETLVTLDDREWKARLAESEADVAVAAATAGTRPGTGQASAQLAAARAQVAQAEAQARHAAEDLERYRALAPRGVVSRQQLDAAVNASAVADAALDAARRQVAAAEAAVSGAGAKLAAARAKREQAALNESWTTVVAPAGGVVSRKSVEPGQLVQPGQPLLAVVPLDDVWVIANLKETELADVGPGDRATIEVDAYPGRKFAAKVESVSPATGARFSLLPPDNATGNFTKVVQRVPVKIRLDGPADPQHPLRPGMSVVATITTR